MSDRSRLRITVKGLPEGWLQTHTIPLHQVEELARHGITVGGASGVLRKARLRELLGIPGPAVKMQSLEGSDNSGSVLSGIPGSAGFVTRGSDVLINSGNHPAGVLNFNGVLHRKEGIDQTLKVLPDSPLATSSSPLFNSVKNEALLERRGLRAATDTRLS